jgi:hypothetical protein
LRLYPDRRRGFASFARVSASRECGDVSNPSPIQNPKSKIHA